jgi:mono/diheme cytochrome c family protein
MKRASFALLALLALAACQDDAPTFSKVAVDLPQDDGTFPAGPGVEAFTANCAACHSADMILNQPALKREQWQAAIKKMREVYKAKIDPAVEPAILDYLEARSAGVR